MPTESVLEIAACIVISALFAYLGGRAHQWYRLGLDRDRSFRDGYRHGYRAFFVMASRGFRPEYETRERERREQQ
ncbi:hypothetical protein [Actinoplanes derwentensis]|uniref:Uncharacterized protein n=1 Tax=Actinoplanes derwentensis TaxID=113562 RepID=A0A1H2BWD8_9ACTN|nr:hypothetical protein [Actinoplanes derwentensis]GID83166.1 hypothetical protein Ade03nite_20900 [Actinoplanes derwentensis]SDT62615.1 hypothetical protein SAMN04489716_4971 [Actinoplanes derwentensis]